MGRVGGREEQLNRRVIKFKLQTYSGGDPETRVGLTEWLPRWSGSEGHRAENRRRLCPSL